MRAAPDPESYGVPMTDLARLRREYGEAGLDEVDAPADPLTLFHAWLDAAVESGMHEPNAMLVATVDATAGEARPSARMVLLKGLDDGFVFYTNYESRKAGELAVDPRCALVFPWHPLSRQVRVEGVAERVSEAESQAYWAQRPRDARLGSLASPQSQVVDSRAELDQRLAFANDSFPGEVPLPEHWGGYRVVPDVVEFWQGRYARMHDRLRYRRLGDQESGGWVLERLAP